MTWSNIALYSLSCCGVYECASLTAKSTFYIVSFRKWSYTLRINFHLIYIECDARSDYRLGFYHSFGNVILSMIKREYSLLNRMRQNHGLYQRWRIFLVRPRAREREIFWKFVILEEVLKIVSGESCIFYSSSCWQHTHLTHWFFPICRVGFLPFTCIRPSIYTGKHISRRLF